MLKDYYRENFLDIDFEKIGEDTLFSSKEQDKKLAEAEKFHSSSYKMDREFTYQKGKDEFYITYAKCGICKLAERKPMEKFLPCMRKMDFSKYELTGGNLIRTKTLAIIR